MTTIMEMAPFQVTELNFITAHAMITDSVTLVKF